ncbi:neuropeptide CCHamide-1-like [Contarinia nasturtii]|uniref:neuropeptide CCHamide-1-like n=1 Tax=Contarinia nasturtii TaxID=265458 RepID=UPI0012D3DD60|nr:neuropeptide CCHamide-1-like [Contarinia nasturtii]
MKAFIYMIICLSFCSELIQCSCLSYGHSCWGAHGKKRSGRIESDDPQQNDRWALFKLIQDENDKVYGKDNIAKVQVDDSLEYNDKRDPSNFLNALRKRNIPLIILNTVDDVGLPQKIQKFETSTVARKRRSYTGQTDAAPIQTSGGINITTNKPSDSASFEHKHFSS